MKTESINKSLANIQDSLKEMESAREQVERVTDSGSKLTDSTNKLAKEVKSFADNVKMELLTTISVFSEKLNLSREVINSINESSNNQIAKNIEKSNNFIEEKIKNSDKDIRVKLDSFKEDVNKLRDNSKKTIGEIATISKSSLETQKKSIDLTIESINEYISKVGVFIKALEEAGIPKKLDDLLESGYKSNDKLDKYSSEIKGVISTETNAIKEIIKNEFEESLTEIRNRTKSMKIIVAVFGVIIIIQSCLIILKVF